MRLLITLLLITACGSAGEMFTDAGKCVSNGQECHQDPVPGPPGPPGEKGRDGEMGPPGPAGSSCTAERAANGATITCTDGTTVVILDGVNGKDGQSTPPQAYSIVEVIDPCGDEVGQFDEILLRLENRQIIGLYGQGSKRYLSFLGPGSYITSDGQRCYYTINSILEVNW